MEVTPVLIAYLLNRLGDFSEWGYVLKLEGKLKVRPNNFCDTIISVATTFFFMKTYVDNHY